MNLVLGDLGILKRNLNKSWFAGDMVLGIALVADAGMEVKFITWR